MIEKQAKHNVNIVSDGSSCNFDKNSLNTKGKETIQFHNKTETRIWLDFDGTALFGIDGAGIEGGDKEEFVVQQGAQESFNCTVDCNASLTESGGAETTEYTDGNAADDSAEQTSTDAETTTSESLETTKPTIIINRD